VASTWLAQQPDDPEPPVGFEDVMALLSKRLAALKAETAANSATDEPCTGGTTIAAAPVEGMLYGACGDPDQFDAGALLAERSA
jgi:hypothetical protein